jgi:putative ABC transport system permease protein
VGTLLGVLGGFGLSRALNSMFWRLTTVDPVVLGSSILMLFVALVAAWVPVHRVTRIDPQQALRHE